MIHRIKVREDSIKLKPVAKVGPITDSHKKAYIAFHAKLMAERGAGQGK